jgi:zinc/manganese transport system substrate-binding protein
VIRQFFASSSVVALFIAAVGVFTPPSADAAPRPRIVTSFFPLYCWTVNVAGEFADVENLLPGRVDPHAYSFTTSDARKLASADLIVVNGLGLESWLPKVQRNGTVATNKIVTVSAGLQTQLLFGAHHHHDHDGHDHAGEQANEHIWLDPTLAAHGVSNILEALQRLDPAHAVAYASNAQSYVARLHQLDADIRTKLAGVTNRAIVTYHDAFPYFTRRYGLEIAGVVEQQPGVPPGPKYLSELGKKIRAQKIPAIFVPPGVRNPLAQRLAGDLKVKLTELDTLESGPLSPSAYEQQMMFNATVLETSLK